MHFDNLEKVVYLKGMMCMLFLQFVQCYRNIYQPRKGDRHFLQTIVEGCFVRVRRERNEAHGKASMKGLAADGVLVLGAAGIKENKNGKGNGEGKGKGIQR